MHWANQNVCSALLHTRCDIVKCALHTTILLKECINVHKCRQ